MIHKSKATKLFLALALTLFAGQALAGHCRLLVNVDDMKTCDYDYNLASAQAQAEEIERELKVSARPIVGKCQDTGNGTFTLPIVGIDVSVYSQEDYNTLRNRYQATPWIQHSPCDFR